MFYGLDNLTVGGGRRYKSPARRLIAATRCQKKRGDKVGVFFLDVDGTAKPGFRTSAQQVSGKPDLGGAMNSMRLYYDYLLPGIIESLNQDSKLFQRIFQAKEEK
jgi:hypothetical protein